MKRSTALLLVIAACVAVTASGCQRIEQALRPGPTVVTQEATTVAQGASVQGELPDGLPAEIPLWPGSKVVEGAVDEGSVTLVLEVAEAYDDVVAGASVGFERAGWTVAIGAEEASATTFDVSGEGFEGVVTVGSADAATRIEYLLVESAG